MGGPQYVGKVDVPKSMLERVGGYEAWTALSWILQHQWIQDIKWSVGIAHVFGASNQYLPNADYVVQHMVWSPRGRIQRFMPADLPGFLSRVPTHKRGEFEKLLLAGYLLGEDYVSPLWVMKPGGKDKSVDLVQTGVVTDFNGANQLEGDLRREWARMYGIKDPNQVSLTRHVVDECCELYRIPEFSGKFATKLNL